MADITVPTLNSTDESYILLEWLVTTGHKVDVGQAIATIETSKAITELNAEEPGYLAPQLPERSICHPGDVVGSLWSSEALARAATKVAVPAAIPGPSPSGEDLIITRSAQELADLNNIDLVTLRTIGKKIIKRVDVAQLIDAHPESAGDHMSAHQRAVAYVVSQSHMTIPSAFIVMKIEAGELIEKQSMVAEELHAFIGVPELVIKAIAAMHERYPSFFASVSEDLAVTMRPRPDIGITVDVGKGLYVPVVKDAARLSVIEIATQLMDFRVRAMRQTMTEKDLTGPAITLSLNVEPGVVLARPIIFPGTVAALSLCATQFELRLSQDGALVPHPFFYLGITYDHRAVNGRDATAFLTSIREELEAPIRQSATLPAQED